jgi:hypothetical protein
LLDPIRFGWEMLAFPPRYLFLRWEKLSEERRRLSLRSGLFEGSSSAGIGGGGGNDLSELALELNAEADADVEVRLTPRVGFELLSKKKDEKVDWRRARMASAVLRGLGMGEEKSSLMSSRAREKRTKRRGRSAIEGSRSSRP